MEAIKFIEIMFFKKIQIENITSTTTTQWLYEIFTKYFTVSDGPQVRHLEYQYHCSHSTFSAHCTIFDLNGNVCIYMRIKITTIKR